MKKINSISIVLSLCICSIFFLNCGQPKGKPQEATPKPSAATSTPEKKVSWFERMDTNKDGKLSKAELDAAKHSFIMKADANKDGFVTKEEVGKWLKQRRAVINKAKANAPKGLGKSTPQKKVSWFEKMDINKDGKLSKAELDAAKHSFIIKADANKDGFVTKEEVSNWLKQRREVKKTK